jgi:adenylate cyclase
MAVCFAAAPITGDASSLQVLAPARKAAAQAAKSNPQLAEAHTAAGFVKFWLEWDYVKAEESFRRAVQLDPSDAAAHRTLAVLLAYQHRHREARASYGSACSLDPLNGANFALAAQVEYFARNWPKAIEFAKRAIEVDSGLWVGYLQLAQARERLGDYEGALEALGQPAPVAANNSKVAALKGYIYGVSGRSDAAREILQQLAELRLQRFVPPYAEACIWLGLGDLEQAAKSLERCIEVHDVHLNFLLADAKWDRMRARPGFGELLARCGFVLSS